MGTIKTGTEQALRINFSPIGAQHWRASVELRKAAEQHGLRGPVEIQLREHNSVCEGNLLL